MSDSGRPLPKGTRERLAACAAVGLHYWADHPAAYCIWAVDKRRRAHAVQIPARAAYHVWAVDNGGRAHVVRVHSDAGTAQHVCGSAIPSVVKRCTGDDEAVPYIAAIEHDTLPYIAEPPGAA
jgi:hypothetical protein